MAPAGEYLPCECPGTSLPIAAGDICLHISFYPLHLTSSLSRVYLLKSWFLTFYSSWNPLRESSEIQWLTPLKNFQKHINAKYYIQLLGIHKPLNPIHRNQEKAYCLVQNPWACTMCQAPQGHHLKLLNVGLSSNILPLFHVKFLPGTLVPMFSAQETSIQ